MRKATITIEQKTGYGDSEVDISITFDPPIKSGDEPDQVTAAAFAMLESIGAVNGVDR